MPPSKHAILSASSSHRWLNCPPSAQLELEFEDRETEAAAVTGVLAGAISMPAEPIPFRADRPFTFVIYDKTNDVTLFTGEYAFAE